VNSSTAYAKKYDGRGNQCTERGMWKHNLLSAHKCAIMTVGQKAKLKPGDSVFDVGIGCGHKMWWLRRAFGVKTTGIDISKAGIEWAQKSLVDGSHCVGDATHMSWVPSDSFDLVFSFATIYHISTAAQQCKAMREMVRIAKPGGLVYNGWNGYFYTYYKTTAEYMEPACWEKCFEGTGHTVEVVQEKAYLQSTHTIFVENRAKDWVTYKSGLHPGKDWSESYAVVITKSKGVDNSKLENMHGGVGEKHAWPYDGTKCFGPH
jgi:ubiquinone/menaquinone biosynthesis C-methylase UbiE